MEIRIDFSQPRFQPCDCCGWLDDLGGVQLVDNTGSRKVFCQQCTVDLVKVCLPRPTVGASYDSTVFRAVALAS